MNSFYNLPKELQTYIYEFDNTYHMRYKEVVEDLNIFFKDSHRFYFMDRNGSIGYKYLNPSNIEQIISEYVSMEEEALEKLKYELIQSYQKERFIILNYPLGYIYINDIVDVIEEIENSITILIHENNYYFE